MDTIFYFLVRKILVAKELLGRKLRREKIENFDINFETPIRTFYEGPVFDPLNIKPGLTAISEIPGCGLWPEEFEIPMESVCNKRIVCKLQPGASFFGDAINVVDVPDEKRVDPRFPPFGWSGESLVGGYALTSSQLEGEVHIEFESFPIDGFLGFKLTQGKGLIGKKSVLSSPEGYTMETRSNHVMDTRLFSNGKLELKSGRFYNFHYNVRFYNSAIVELLSINPGLGAPPLLFPGTPYSGHAFGHLKFDKSDNSFKIAIYSGMFLPLDSSAQGRLIKMPGTAKKGPFEEAFLARNSSLHPFISINAASKDLHPISVSQSEKLKKACLSKENSISSFICIPQYNCFGDIFTLNSPSFQEVAKGKTPVLGKIEIQFGSVIGNAFPYILNLRSWSELFSEKIKKVLTFLPPGTKAGLIGIRGILDFKSIQHIQSNLSINSDSQKLSIGTVNLDHDNGRHKLIIRAYFFLDVLARLMVIEPRTPTDSFAFVSEASFSVTDDGFLIYQSKGNVHIPYPNGYKFPLPKGKGGAIVGTNSFLLPFFDICAIEKTAFQNTELLPVSIISAKIIRGLCRKVIIKSKILDNNKVEWIVQIDKKSFIGYSSKTAQEVKGVLGFTTIWYVEISFSRLKKSQTVLFFHINSHKKTITSISNNENLGFWISYE